MDTKIEKSNNETLKSINIVDITNKGNTNYYFLSRIIFIFDKMKKNINYFIYFNIINFVFLLCERN